MRSIDALQAATAANYFGTGLILASARDHSGEVRRRIEHDPEPPA